MDKIKKSITISHNKDTTLEKTLLQFYLIVQIIWAAFNALMAYINKMPVENMLAYLGFFAGLVFFFCLNQKLKQNKFLHQFYFVAMIITMPVLWYYAGGSRTSANVLYVSETILFVMCLSGWRQKVLSVIALISAPLTQAVSMRVLEQPVFPMSPLQYQKGSSVVGLSTSVLIMALLLRQKYEYIKERDRAIEGEKALMKSNALQKNFLANMSHEIRSPLGIVMGFNDLIKDCNDLEQIHDYSKNISKSGATLLTVINDILDYSKIESGKLDIIEVNYSLKSLVSDVKRDIKLKCDEKGLHFKTKLDLKLPDSFHGDNIRIKQCLINVLSNAVKYTDRGEVKFYIELEDHIYENEYVIRFIIKDTGRGISKEAIPEMFNAFQRLDEAENRTIEGTGLGMAITKNLLDEMKGTIEVESEVGVGSTFIIHLRQKVGNDRIEIDDEISTYSLEGVKILTVDDTKLNLILIQKLLEKEGADVTTIDNGPDCLADLEKNEYDVILLDHMMPGMNGVEVYEKIRQNGIDTPVVMLTANAMAGVSQEYLDMGFDGYLSKPISPKDLKELMFKLGVEA